MPSAAPSALLCLSSPFLARPSVLPYLLPCVCLCLCLAVCRVLPGRLPCHLSGVVLSLALCIALPCLAFPRPAPSCFALHCLVLPRLDIVGDGGRKKGKGVDISKVCPERGPMSMSMCCQREGGILCITFCLSVVPSVAPSVLPSARVGR